MLREREKVGGQAALRSGSCVCGSNLNLDTNAEVAQILVEDPRPGL